MRAGVPRLQGHVGRNDDPFADWVVPNRERAAAARSEGADAREEVRLDITQRGEVVRGHPAVSVLRASQAHRIMLVRMQMRAACSLHSWVHSWCIVDAMENCGH